MSTTTTYRQSPAWRRQCLRLERGLIEPESFGAFLSRAWSDHAPRQLTDAEWRYIGQCNGRLF